jgi:hypothetical protein
MMSDAKTLDKKLRAAANRAANNLHDLLTLMETATAQQAHVALGFATPTAYFYDAARIAPTDQAHRKLLAAIISDRRLTPKAIAEAFGIDHANGRCNQLGESA